MSIAFGSTLRGAGSGARARRRLVAPEITMLESRRLLSTPTLTFLSVSANALTYGQQDVLTATVTTNPPSDTTPSGGIVSFMDGATVLDTENLGAGGIATFTTTGLPAGSDVISAAYGGDSDFGGSSTPSMPVLIMSTVAGGGNGDGGAATSSSLGSPFGVVVDSQR